MAIVYLAHDAKHERRVALKVLSEELSSAVGAQRFLQEIKLTAALQHPHILPVYDSGATEAGTLFYVMPFVEGGSLRYRFETESRLAIQDVVRITREVAGALAFSHDRGIVHRDIKPENILFLGGHALLADFGIARMVTVETAERLTMQGSVLGTPEYMSPEQGLAMPVDARSDIYSLACVAYEMLTGSVPFTGSGGGVWVEGRLSRAPESVWKHRPDLPAALDDVIVRALAPSPSDRFQSIREFADALESAAGGGLGPRVEVHRARRTGMLMGMTIAVVALIGTAAVTSPMLQNGLISLGIVKLDSMRVFVAPFQSDAVSAGPAKTTERLLREELARWGGGEGGLRVLSASATADAIGDTGPLTIDGAIRAARKSRAGLVVWGRAEPDTQGVTLDVQLFDGRTEANRADAVVHVARGSDPRPLAVQTAAAILLAGGDASLAPQSLRAAGATHSLRAWRAYVDGHRALSDWRLAAAESAFAAAAAADPRFPQPRVWLAQSMVWNRRGSRSEWERYAQEALLLAAKLDTTDLLIARAMEAFGKRDDPRACVAYRALVARDSVSAIGWLGLGDCQAIDSAVVRDARSPSGFAFRGSLSRAVAAYQRAVRLTPGAHAALPLSFVERVLQTQSDRYRHGVGAAAANQVFAARPSASGDTVAYIPRRIAGNALPPDPPAFEEGLQRNRALLLEYVKAWSQRAPSSVDAYEALASVQESRAELTESGGEGSGNPSALGALDSARRLSGNREDRARIGASQVRVLLKTGDVAGARTLADTLLANARTATAGEAHWLAGIAAFTGRAKVATRLARLGQPPAPPVDWDTLPPVLADAATMLLLQSAYGVCEKDFAASFDRLDDMIESYTAPAYRERTRDQLTNRARLLSVPCLGAKGVTRTTTAWERMAQQHARGETAAVRASFDTLLASRRYRRPGGTALDYTFLESWLLAAIGDTVAGARHLDLTLNALPTLNRNAVWELAQAATVGRAMAWRADLAFRRGDVQNGKRWASAVVELWKNADAELEPVVTRMRQIVGSR